MKEKVFRLKIFIFGFLVSCCALSCKLYAQDSISDIINTYAVVKEIFNNDPNNQDTIRINDTTGLGLQEQGAVLIIQMKGADLSSGEIQNINNTGLYEFVLIREFLPDNRIILARNLLNNYDPVEVVQLISVPLYNYAVVHNTLTCVPWNDSTGGVLAMVVFDTLELQANINVSGYGFKGAVPDSNTGYCGNTSVDCNFTESSTRAGRKGQGIGTVSYSFTKGSYPAANGGGGDHGNYSGAGGGAHYGYGSIGGVEIETCGSTLNGLGGTFSGKESILFNVSNPRAFMGGGGGTTTLQDSDLAYKGGNGGGIVIIISSHIIGNNHSIRANGEDVTDGAETGGSGGGAGGSVYLAVDTVTDSIRIEAIGGKGGSVNNPSYCTGAGGGGGGGVLWHAWPILMAKPGTYVLNFNGGAGGNQKGGCGSDWVGVAGGSGTRLDSLHVPLNGFLFNVMPPDQTICEDETPDIIRASYPKGGDGTYTFIWEQKTKTTNWVPASGTGNQKNYAPPVLTDTTFYRRIVQSGTGNEFVSDTSFTLTVNVHPLIQTNTIAADQIICENDVPKPLTGSTPTGGIGIYFKQWEASFDNDLFTEISSETGFNHSPGSLTDTVYYRRRVNSGVCVDYSDTVTITVLPSIKNNVITDNQEICDHVVPDPLTGTDGVDGDGTYKYQWESNANGAGWDSITYTTVNTGYAPPSLSDSTTYRRIVLSGLNDVCKDTSNIVSISVLPLITNNNIAGGDTVCQYIPPDDFLGTQAGGGNGITYTYQWIWSPDTINWDSVTTIVPYDVYNPGGLLESGYFKRVARSGWNDCCKDTSTTAIWVKVYPAILNNTLSDNQEICLHSTPETITGGSPEGGDGLYAYSWEVKTPTTAWSNLGVTDTLYTPASPDDAGTYFYRRVVVSNVCIHYSDSLILSVLPLLDNNDITGDQTVCYNTVPDSLVGAFPSGGEDSVYRYKWLLSTDLASWENIGAVTQTYSPPALTIPSYFKRVVFSGKNDCCKDTSSYITIGIWDLPVANLNAITNFDTACAGDTRVLKFTLSGASPWIVNYTDGLNAQSVTLESETDSIYIYPDYTSNFELTEVIDHNGCIATDMSGAVNIMVYDIPVPDPGTDTSVCGLTVYLNAIPSHGNGKWSEFPVSNGIFYPDTAPSTNYVASDSAYGLHVMQWTETNWKCIRTAEKEVTFFEQPTKIDAGEDIDVYGKLETQLNATTPSVGTGTWSKISGSGSVVDINDPQTIVDSLVMGQNLLLLWTVDNDVCNAIYDSLDIYTQPVTPPTGFSPNGDRINDCFEIGGIDIFSKNHLIIFNRWGSIVFETDNYNNDWTGTGPNNKELPEDTYFYIFTGTTIYGDDFSRKGYFVIKRK